MQNVQPSLFTRDDTFFGVCQGLGEDFGFNPVLLRVAIPFPLFLYPVETAGAYVAAGFLVLFSRLAFPNPRLSTQGLEAPADAANFAPVTVENPAPQLMPLAA